MRKKLIITLVIFIDILALGLLLSGKICAQENSYKLPPKAAGGKMRGRVGAGMRLTPEQKEKIKAIREKYNAKMEVLNFDIQKIRYDLMDELRKPEPDRAVIDVKMDKIMVLQRQKYKLIMDEFFEVRNILNAQQANFFINRIIMRMMSEK